MNPRILQQFCANVLAISLLAHFSLGHDAQAQENKDALDKDYSSELPRFKPLSPQEALASFQILPGFRIELVAAEPLVVDPIAFAFDARSRLFVIEMRDYSEQDTECLGRVALLTDTDQDGVMDQRSTFAEGLSWPTALYPWRDGVLVAAPPKLTWYRDTNDDGVSDTQEEWLTGFHRTNVQGMVNSLRWGVDGYIHGATSSTGADLDNKVSSAGTKLQLRRTDFAIDPLSQTVIPESGGGQHGLSFNRWGDKFVTSNSDHLQQIVNLETWLRQNRSSIPMPALRKSIALDGRQAEVFRASPIEPWRILRTRLRVGGLV
ncbi:MAG: PVC-type heme-binding CxxCH protein, partial [Planctomycetota bacterium]